MAWSTPATFSDGTVLTAAQLNTMRDNFNETAPAKATAAGQLFVSTSANAIAARTPATAIVTTSQTTGSTGTGGADLATPGPSIAMTTGANAIIFVTSVVQNNTAAENTYAGYEVSGATTIAMDDTKTAWLYSSAIGQGARISATSMETGLTPGSNTFKMKYRVSGGTGTFLNRRITGIPL